MRPVYASPRVFRLARWAVAAFVVTTTAAMLAYPGGTLRDRSTNGYRFFENFLSDLGMTVTWSGRSNDTAALLFIVGEVFLVVALVPCFAAFVRLYASSDSSRGFARAAAVTAAIAGFGFIAGALAPSNRWLGLHVLGVVWAFRMALLTSLFFTIATRRHPRLPWQIPVAWFVLTLALGMYVVMLNWGPAIDTDRGLTLQVLTQKITVGALLLIVGYQSIAAEREHGKRQNAEPFSGSYA